MKILTAIAIAACAPLLAACPGPRPEANIVPQKIEVQTMIPCPDKRLPAPAYADSEAELQALADTVARVKRLKEANVLLHQRTKEDDDQIANCAAPPAP